MSVIEPESGRIYEHCSVMSMTCLKTKGTLSAATAIETQNLKIRTNELFKQKITKIISEPIFSIILNASIHLSLSWKTLFKTGTHF